MEAEAGHKKTRVISVVAATVIALACGTNYVYSAWAPQFAQRLKLSSTETNLIGTMGNLGMYATGIPAGIVIDNRGPRWGVAIGLLLFCGGYYPLAKAFDAGPGSYGILALCLFSFFTGAGSCTAFNAAIKAAALNFPTHRGTATAFPLSAFGLSAFFFATLALALPHDTSHFLRLLAVGTVVMPAASFLFMRTGHTRSSYEQLPQHESQRLRRTSFTDAREGTRGTNTSQRAITQTKTSRPTTPTTYGDLDGTAGGSEQSSLLSEESTPGPGTPRPESKSLKDEPADSPPPDLDIRGMRLLPLREFWLLFVLLGLLCGIGLMTINNIGAVAQALWQSHDPDTPASYITQRQALHVSLLSVMSFTGRLTSGIGSDILVRKYMLSRFWCVFASSVVFICAQVAALTISNPVFLVLVSGMTGLAYGILFGVYPSLVAHTFGVHGLSQNWGTMTLAPVVSGNIFNLIYGSIFDAHSIVDDMTGDRKCLQGKSCYSGAYVMTLGASLAALLLCLYSIWHDNAVNRQRHNKAKRKDVATPFD